MAVQFAVANIEYMTHGSAVVGGALVPKRIGIKSADVTCGCGHSWTAKSAPDLYGMLGAIRFTCPVCEMFESIGRKELNF